MKHWSRGFVVFAALLCLWISPGSAQRPGRANADAAEQLLAMAPPSIDTGEMTDKGSINQRAVLKSRGALVDELYTEPRPPHVIAIEESA